MAFREGVHLVRRSSRVDQEAMVEVIVERLRRKCEAMTSCEGFGLVGGVGREGIREETYRPKRVLVLFSFDPVEDRPPRRRQRDVLVVVCE